MTRVLRPKAAGPFLIFCDHASNFIPEEYGNLGLPGAELARHIAWDIGAAGIAEWLSEEFDSPAILCGTSRLLIDCNRHVDAVDLIPEISDRTVVPGNQNVSGAERASRLERWFHPYHRSVESVFIDRETRGIPSIALSIHSMTDNMAGVPRPWEISLSSYTDRMLADPVIAALRLPADILIGDNEPYDLNPGFDYSTPFHALRRNLPHLQVEFRQDLIHDSTGQVAYARRFADALRLV